MTCKFYMHSELNNLSTGKPLTAPLDTWTGQDFVPETGDQVAIKNALYEVKQRVIERNDVLLFLVKK